MFRTIQNRCRGQPRLNLIEHGAPVAVRRQGRWRQIAPLIGLLLNRWKQHRQQRMLREMFGGWRYDDDEVA